MESVRRIWFGHNADGQPAAPAPPRERHNADGARVRPGAHPGAAPRDDDPSLIKAAERRAYAALLAAAERGGWFHSGDLGVVHADGYIELKDRSKDIIISGGENISTIEVEGVIYSHPGVLEAAVVARPDEKWGETPCAFVTLKDGADASEQSIIDFCRDNLAHFKCPTKVVFGPLPKTATGKIQKFQLREQAKEI